MPYSTFKSIGEVTQKFDIEARTETFIDKKEIKIPDCIFSRIQASLMEDAYFINEFAICEHVISRILDEVAAHYKQLLVWSRVPFNIDVEKGLVGEPDYLIAPKTKHGVMFLPPLCVMEAKQEKWHEGWAQTVAEMYAASVKGAKTCYGVVTTGKAWEFGKLENKIFTKDPSQISATEDLQKVLDVLNWLFDRANAHADELSRPVFPSNLLMHYTTTGATPPAPSTPPTTAPPAASTTPTASEIKSATTSTTAPGSPNLMKKNPAT